MMLSQDLEALRAEMAAVASGAALMFSRADCGHMAAALDAAAAQARALETAAVPDIARHTADAGPCLVPVRPMPTACPDCGGPVPADAGSCPHCRCPIPTPADHDRPEGADARDGAA
ncbi:hypothetical protein [Roseospira goensis]|uniref:Uncharacterized protein n=1 Tax=Roseospira goensis TaxID=391922 RepID=A0A7W6WLZ9_9PROT|nr:hypothetical protein [Roseospira goensis]MBB4287399.1 hypothetical protein [Roseospira goensis]